MAEQQEVEWLEMGEDFGSAMPYGSCNAKVGEHACGWPRKADGTCHNGHPAQPPKKPT